MNIKERINELVASGQLPVIEVHLLRPVEGSNKNRDFNNRIKTIFFGKGNRVRWSSQAKKKATNKPLAELSAELTGICSVHSRMLPCNVKRQLEELFGEMDEQATAYVNAVEAYLGSGKDAGQTDQVMFFSNLNVEHVAKAYYDFYAQVENKAKVIEALLTAKGTKNKDKKSTAEQKMLEDLKKKMAADAAKLEVDPMAAVFGKMATDPSLGQGVPYAAVRFGHAYSVDKAHDDIDTYVATDDLLLGNKYAHFITGKNTQDMGSAYMGDVDMSANVFYEYVDISTRVFLENLISNYTEETLTEEILAEKLEVVKKMTRCFLNLFVVLTPEAKSSTMRSNPLPYVALVVTGRNMYTHTTTQYEKLVTGAGYDSIGDEAVARLSKQANFWANGAFARDYDHMYWVTDMYKDLLPEGAEDATMKTMLNNIFA